MLELLLTVLLSTAEQTTTRPVIRVFGKGALVIETPAPDLTTAQAYVWRAYIGTQPPVVFSSSVCGPVANKPGFFECAVPLSQMPLTTTAVTFSVTSSITGADGAGESLRFTPPFDLGKAEVPATPTGASVRPPL
jgi:hypothetical protein